MLNVEDAVAYNFSLFVSSCAQIVQLQPLFVCVRMRVQSCKWIGARADARVMQTEAITTRG